MSLLVSSLRRCRPSAVLSISPLSTPHRCLSTLPNNPHIYVHPQASGPTILSYLSTSPPTSSLAIGTTTAIPPTPESLVENPHFISVLHHVARTHAVDDPEVQAQAAMFASSAGSSLGSGGSFFPQQRAPRQRKGNTFNPGGSNKTTNSVGMAGSGAGGASSQGGMGGAGKGGFVHVSDQRNPPDFGRVAWPEDILGSLEIDVGGKFVDGTGRYQEAGTYRVVTREGILGLSTFLRGKLIDRLKKLEEQTKRNG